jgi:hypothetical protein
VSSPGCDVDVAYVLALSCDCVYDISSSSSSRSSTPDKETFALASKNCFQNYPAISISFTAENNYSQPLILPRLPLNDPHIAQQSAGYLKSQYDARD